MSHGLRQGRRPGPYVIRSRGSHLLLRDALGGCLGVALLEDKHFYRDVGTEADLREEGSDLPAADLLDGLREPWFHRALEGEACFADCLGFAAFDQRLFEGYERVFEEADDVVVADDGSDAVGPASVMVALKFCDCVRN